MGRTDWGMVIIGGGALLGIAYAFFNWKTICPQVLGAENCTGGGIPGLFGGTITNNTMPAQGYGQILTNPTTGQKQVIRTSTPTTGAKASVGAKTSIPKKPRLNASGSVGAGAGAGYTNVNSFATITLNKLSVR
jgi:hypothetical protein